MWPNHLIILAIMVFSTYAEINDDVDSIFNAPPPPWIIYTVYGHLGLVAILYIIIIALLIYYHRMVTGTHDDNSIKNPIYFEPGEKSNYLDKNNHDLFQRKKGVDNHYDTNPIKFSGFKPIAKDEDAYVTVKETKNTTSQNLKNSYINVTLQAKQTNLPSVQDEEIYAEADDPDDYDVAKSIEAPNNKIRGNYDVPKIFTKSSPKFLESKSYINVNLKTAPATKKSGMAFMTKDDEEIYKFNHLNMNGPINNMEENYESFNTSEEIYNEIEQGDEIYEVL